MITTEIKNRILSVINIFETGTPEGDYANITIYADGKKDKNGRQTRQITYGIRQTTEQYDLGKLIKLYVEKKGEFADEFAPFLPKIGKNSLVDDKEFIRLLKISAEEDPIMIQAQDEFFEKNYYTPAEKFFSDNKFTYPLSMLVIFDSQTQSGKVPDWLRDNFREVPPAQGGDEKAWVNAYTSARHKWLSNHRNDAVRRSNYRTQSLLLLIATGDWVLSKPINVKGQVSRAMGS